MKKAFFLAIITLLLSHTAESQINKRNGLSQKEVESQISTNENIQYRLLSISKHVWPKRKIEDKTLGRYIFRVQQNNKTGKAEDLPYTFMAIYDKSGNLIGESNHSYGSIYDEHGREIVEVVLPNDTDFDSVNIYILSGFQKSAEAFHVDND